MAAKQESNPAVGCLAIIIVGAFLIYACNQSDEKPTTTKPPIQFYTDGKDLYLPTPDPAQWQHPFHWVDTPVGSREGERFFICMFSQATMQSKEFKECTRQEYINVSMMFGAAFEMRDVSIPQFPEAIKMEIRACARAMCKNNEPINILYAWGK